MFQTSRDLIVQEIQAFFQALAWVIHANSEGRPGEAYAYISELFSERLQNDARDISELSPKDVLALCDFKGKFSPEMATAMAPLLEEKAALEREQDNLEVARSSLMQAKALYLAAILEPGKVPLMGMEERVQRIERRLDELNSV